MEGELCRRCYKNPAVKEAETKEAVKSDHRYKNTGAGTSLHQWKETTVRIPRCLNCKKADENLDAFGVIFGLFVLAGAGLLSFFWLFPVYPWSRSIAIAAFGGVLIIGALGGGAYLGFLVGRRIGRAFVSYG